MVAEAVKSGPNVGLVLLAHLHVPVKMAQVSKTEVLLALLALLALLLTLLALALRLVLLALLLAPLGLLFALALRCYSTWQERERKRLCWLCVALLLALWGLICAAVWLCAIG